MKPVPVGIKIFLAAALAAGGVTVGLGMRNSGRHAETRSMADAKGRPGQTVLPAAGAPVVIIPPSRPQRKRLPYQPGNMFGNPDDSNPAPILPNAPAFVPPMPVPDEPIRHLSFTGTAVMGDDAYATILDDRTGTETPYKVGDHIETYTIVSITPKGVTLRMGKTDTRIAMTDRSNPIPMQQAAPRDVQPNPGNLTSFRDKTNQNFYFQVTGSSAGTVWGSGGIYTDDSALATAAVHSGALKDGESGVVQVTVLPGYDHYDGATSNGVTSQSYAQWQGSYRVSRF